MILDLVYYGEPLLRERCKEVEVFDDAFRSFVRDMIDSLKKYQGAGISAPQLGKALRAFVIVYTGTDSRGMPIMGDPIVYINPVVELVDQETWVYDEGCLSIPDLYAPVERPWKVRIKAQDMFGKPFEEIAEGWKAKAILHENDHLNGVLFIDRIPNKIKNQIKPKLRFIKKQFSKSKA